MAIGCPDCGTLQTLPPLSPNSTATCQTCEADLERTSGRSITGALACSLATLVLLVIGNIYPLIHVDLFGMQRQNVILLGIMQIWSNQWVLLAGATAVLVIIFPFLRFGLLTVALGAVRFGFRPKFLGRIFRWSMWLDPWAMADVFLLASCVGYYRMINLSQAHVSVEIGGICFTAAGFLTMLSRATLDQRTVWRAIGPEAEPAPGEPVLSCTTCDLIQPLAREGHRCPRCRAKLYSRKPDALIRTTALAIAAFVLFFPANIYPMDISTHLGMTSTYTIFTGVRDLFKQGLWPLGCIIFCTSILIPFSKIMAIAWCVLSVRWRSSRHLIRKTKIFRVTAELGRWSKTDPFTIVFFVPLVDFAPLASAHAGWGAIAFMLMSIFTMAATTTFDPRLMWDVATGGLEQARSDHRQPVATTSYCPS